MVRGAAGAAGSTFRQPQSLAAGREGSMSPGKEDWEGVKLKSEAGAFLEGRLPEIARLNVN